MKSVALITEYNPFHNGHLYHAMESKSITGADVSIAIMSGSFVMRGEPAMYNKFTRAQMALSAVDLVVELPIYGALSAGQHFADMGVRVADYMAADSLCFGSESGDITALQSCAETLTQIKARPAFHTAMKAGASYAQTLSELSGNHPLLQSPNNTLGLSYLQALMQHAPHITPYTIRRDRSAHHHTAIDDHTYASGTAIRNAIMTNDALWHNVTPAQNHTLFAQQAPVSVDHTFQLLKFATLSMSIEALRAIHTMSEGFEYRLKSAITRVDNYADLMHALKTKRYTYTHIQRILMNVLLGLKQANKPNQLDGVRILAMSHNGQRYLKQLKQQYPERHYVTNVTQAHALRFQHEIHTTHVYNLISGHHATDFNTPVIRPDRH